MRALAATRAGSRIFAARAASRRLASSSSAPTPPPTTAAPKLKLKLKPKPKPKAPMKQPGAAGVKRAPSSGKRQPPQGRPPQERPPQRRGQSGQKPKRSLMPHTVEMLANLSIADVNSRLMAALRQRTVQTPTSIHAIFALWSALLDVQAMRLGKMKAKLPEKQLNALRPTTITYNLMLKACFLSPSDRLDQVIELNERMVDTGIKRTEVTFAESIKCCSRKGAHKQAFAFLNEMEKLGMDADTVVHHFIIATCARSGAFNEAEKHLRGALAMGAQPAGAAGGASDSQGGKAAAGAAAGATQTSKRRKGGAKQAVAMLAPRPTSEMFTVVITEALRLMRPPSLAMRFVEMAVDEANVAPTSSVISEVLIAAIDVDDLDTAAAAFAVLRRPQIGVTVDSGIYVTLHNAAARTGNFALSDAVCEALVEQDDGLNEAHFRAKLFTHCTLPGREDSISTIFTTMFDMASSGFEPSAAMRTVVARRLANSSASIDQAYYELSTVCLAQSLKADAAQSGARGGANAPIVADHSALALLEACCELRDTERAFATMNDWEKISAAPSNVAAYNLLLRACVDGQAAGGGGQDVGGLGGGAAAPAPLDLVRRVRALMAHNEVEPDVHTHEVLTLAFVRSKVMDAANAALDEILARDVPHAPSPALIEIVLRRNARDGNDARVAELLRAMTKREVYVSRRLRQFVSDFATEPVAVEKMLEALDAAEEPAGAGATAGTEAGVEGGGAQKLSS